jgi:hypothetical protein
MKTLIFAGAAVTLLSGAAMAQAVMSGAPARPNDSVSMTAPNNNSVLETGVAGSAWTTGTPGYSYASPSVIQEPLVTNAPAPAPAADNSGTATGVTATH